MPANSATGAMTAISDGNARPVIIRKMRIVCPLLVRRSIWRRACVIQMTPVSTTRPVMKAVAAVLRT